MDAFTAALALYALTLAILALANLTRGERSRLLDLSFAGLAALVTARAALDAALMLAGHRPAELPVHLAYLGTITVEMPLVLGATASDHGRWATALRAGGAALCCVLLIRLQATWRAASA